MTKMSFFFSFSKKGRGQRIPSPSLCVVSGEAVNIEFFYFRNNEESDKNRTFFDMVTGTSSSFKVINQSLTTSYEYFFSRNSRRTVGAWEVDS